MKKTDYVFLALFIVLVIAVSLINRLNTKPAVLEKISDSIYTVNVNGELYAFDLHEGEELEVTFNGEEITGIHFPKRVTDGR